MTKGLVSVVMPVYNAEKFVETAINSVLNQTYKNIEIILVDDCSTDGSSDIILNMAKENLQIRYYRLEKNSGVAAARNKAIEIASGQYLAFLDSDDVWKKDKIQKQIEDLNAKGLFFSYTAMEMIDESGNIINTCKRIREIVDYKYLLKNTVISTSSVLLDVDEIGKPVMPILKNCEDYITWLRILKKGYNAVGINEPLLQYRKTSNSLSSKKGKNIFYVWDAQVNYLGENRIFASINCLYYAFNGFKKHYLK